MRRTLLAAFALGVASIAVAACAAPAAYIDPGFAEFLRNGPAP